MSFRSASAVFSACVSVLFTVGPAVYLLSCLDRLVSGSGMRVADDVIFIGYVVLMTSVIAAIAYGILAKKQYAVRLSGKGLFGAAFGVLIIWSVLHVSGRIIAHSDLFLDQVSRQHWPPNKSMQPTAGRRHSLALSSVAADRNGYTASEARRYLVPVRYFDHTFHERFIRSY